MADREAPRSLVDLARTTAATGFFDALAIGYCIDRTQRIGRRWNRALKLAAIVLGAVVTLATGSWLGLFACCVYFVLRAVVFGALARRGTTLLDAYFDAYHRRDLETVRRFHAVFQRQRPRGVLSTALADLDGATELILEERWTEARAALGAIDVTAFPEEQAVMACNNLAFVTALAGDPAAAIPVARDVAMRASTLAAVHRLEPRFASYARGTLGIALSLAGEHEEAIEVLRPLVEEEAPASIVAVRAFHLGESLRATGDHLGAATAYAKAEADAGGRWAERARAARLQLSPHR